MKLEELVEGEFYLYEYLDNNNSFILQYKNRECIGGEGHYPMYRHIFTVISSNHFGFQNGDNFWIIGLNNKTILKKL